jgi:cell shape-determining protein MreD
MAGLFLDIFSYASLGISIVLLMAIAFLVKKTQSLLKEEKDDFSLVHFALLFSVSFILYSLLLQTCIFIFVVPHVFPKFSLSLIVEIIYNLMFAVLAFLICKKYVKKINERI